MTTIVQEIPTKYKCPVCGYPDLPEPPLDMSYEICPSCGTEFGYTDFAISEAERTRIRQQLFVRWWRGGRPAWHANWMRQPREWNPRKQVIEHLVPQIHHLRNTADQPMRLQLVGISSRRAARNTA
jgi:hypothetical protein